MSDTKNTLPAHQAFEPSSTAKIARTTLTADNQHLANIPHLRTPPAEGPHPYPVIGGGSSS